MAPIVIFWHRRDLRLFDNHGLFESLQSGYPVLPLFIFDTNILEKLTAKDDARVTFIHERLRILKEELEDRGSSMLIKHGKPIEIWHDILKNFKIAAVYTNRDYEPYAQQRDEEIKVLLKEEGIPFYTFKDHVIYEHTDIVKKDGTPYTVFTPYKRRWLEQLAADGGLPDFHSEGNLENLRPSPPLHIPTLAELGFVKTNKNIPPAVVSQKTITGYEQNRNFPAINGTSKLGVHFRFGTISIREKAKKAQLLSDTYLSELIWRDFYAMILSNFPHVATHPFRKEYAAIKWLNNEEDFGKWCQGKTGYPIVDAGMRELNHTGYMHNRVRMITASFLTKHLLIDWRWGEAYFAAHLLDYDLASNNGGWQWAAGCGTDAAPYFRIFNPTAQQEKFDKEWKYIRKWVPEVDTPAYPKPMVEHKFARERCLMVYKEALAQNKG